DGYNDGWEVDYGYDPLDPDDYPRPSWWDQWGLQIMISIGGSVAGGIVGLLFFFLKRKLKKKAEKVGAKE
ncbi:unnamed protein product, partial [marine sediment metagenome]